MKDRLYAVYQVVNVHTHQLTFVADGFTSEQSAVQAINGYAGGRFTIQVYYQ